MISPIEAGRAYFVEANEPRLIEKDLNAAVDEALEDAMTGGRHGILVTRRGHTTFTVEVSDEVPYGQTKKENGPARAQRTAEDPDSRAS